MFLDTIVEAVEFGLEYLDAFKYLTYWTWSLVLIYFITAAYGHFKHDIKGEAFSDSASPFESWKVVSALFAVILPYTFIVTSVFWLTIYPFVAYRMTYWLYSRHIIPMLALAIDFSMNRIIIETRQVIVSLVMGLIYVSFLYAYVKSGNEKIYSFAGFEDAASVLFVLGIAIVGVIWFYIFAGLNRIKYTIFPFKSSASFPMLIKESASGTLLVFIP